MTPIPIPDHAFTKIDAHITTATAIRQAYEHLRRALSLYALGRYYHRHLGAFLSFGPEACGAAMAYYAAHHAADLADIGQRFGLPPFVTEASARRTRHAVHVAREGGHEITGDPTKAPASTLEEEIRRAS